MSGTNAYVWMCAYNIIKSLDVSLYADRNFSNNILKGKYFPKFSHYILFWLKIQNLNNYPPRSNPPLNDKQFMKNPSLLSVHPSTPYIAVIMPFFSFGQRIRCCSLWNHSYWRNIRLYYTVYTVVNVWETPFYNLLQVLEDN